MVRQNKVKVQKFVNYKLCNYVNFINMWGEMMPNNNNN